MKRFLALFILIITLSISGFAQEKRTWESDSKDPLHARIYTLDNGLKVYLTVYKDAPRIQCYIPVKVGSKNDPKETTGLAHYFEHMMFKGTPDFGTTDWEKESPMIDKIEQLFEVYRITENKRQRDSIYHLIDSVSYEASKLAIPNEYDKIMKYIGSQGTNAATSNDYTIYVENIPSNQLENWAIVQANRFKKPVLRLFHTELETVYEEKNMSLTNDQRKVNEAIMSALFPNHPYGQQTTLGKSEHLKNPSMKNIRLFYNSYYVPNNMAICLSGDFDYDEAMTIIEKYFGQLQSGTVPTLHTNPEQPIKEPIIKEVKGLEAENVSVAFRLGLAANSKDVYLLNMMDYLLSNGKAGLIDINLNQQQKVYSATAYASVLCDNSYYVLSGKPKTGQSLDEVKSLLLEQIQLIKEGHFTDKMMEASLNNLKLKEIRQLENNQARAMMMARSFINGIPWDEACQSLHNYSAITRQEVIDFANQHFKDDNYVVVYKRQDKPEEVEKVEKPAITPIFVNRDAESDFFIKIKNRNVPPIEPVFVDYKKEISFLKNKGVEVGYIRNTENNTFTLSFIFDFGEMNDLRLPFAVDFFDYAGTSQYSAEKLKEEFYRLACHVSIRCRDDKTYVNLNGLSDNFAEALHLFFHTLSDAQPNQTVLDNMIQDVIKNRADAKNNQQAVANALRLYGIYGPELCKYSLSEQQLRSLKSDELILLLRQMLTFCPQVTYYGPEEPHDFIKILSDNYSVPKKFVKPTAGQKFDPQAVTESHVFFAPYEAKQARLYTYLRGDKYNKQLHPLINMYNQYFGGGMNAIVFQEMREKRSLAYSAQSRYVTPSDKDDYMYNYSFIATQNDKIVDAFTAFNELFNDMPLSETAFNLAKQGAKTAIETNRITKSSILNSYIANKQLGYDYDYRKDLYAAIKTLTLKDISDFNQHYIKNKPKNYIILSKENDLDFEIISNKFGKITRLSLEDIFGY